MASFEYGGLVEQVAITATASGTTTFTNTSKQVEIFTGSLAQTIVLPDATTMSVGQKFEIYNESTGSLTIQFNGGTAFTDAADISYTSLSTNTALVIKLQTNGTAAGTWAVLSSASGGQWILLNSTSLAAAGTITISLTGSHAGFQAFRVASSGGAVTLSTTPFGTSAPLDGAVFRLIGTSDTNTIAITNTDSAKGCMVNGNPILVKGSVIDFMYSATDDRYWETSRNF